jgi:hypothetical protein
MNQEEKIVPQPIGIVCSPIKEVADDCWAAYLPRLSSTLNCLARNAP